MFEDFIKEGSVRKVSPNRQLAKSLIKIANLRLKNTETMKITDENSFNVVENCYEAIREMIDALMSLRGFKSYSHEATVEFLKEFYSMKVGYAVVSKVDRYRRLRNDIKYEGLLTTKSEAEEILKNTKIVTSILMQLLEKEGLKK
jgi:predicted transcriptional regulator